ncbi:MAG TPA: hypothetical protein VM533_22370 [Fimbriiglobus sp.]|nr:hypothetical protein [Fimbriiglobus sp.]
MMFHPERYLAFGLLLLLFSVVAPPVADWLRANYQLPPGYGAEGDRQRAYHIPATADRWRGPHLPGPVRKAVESQSAGSDANWVKETVEDGAWVYELHVLKEDKWSVIRIAPNGNLLPPNTRDSNPGTALGAGG